MGSTSDGEVKRVHRTATCHWGETAVNIRSDTSGANPSFFEGDITYYPASTDPDGMLDSSWHVANAALTLNGTIMKIYPSPPAPGILQSSGPLILGPEDMVRIFYKELNRSLPTVDLGNGHYAYQCNGGVTDLDVDVGFTISRNGRDFKVGETDFYNMQADDLAYGAAPAQEYVRAGYSAMEGKEGDWCWGIVTAWRS